MSKPVSFTQMSIASCAKAYKLALKNAESHADSAKRIARGKNYGHAVSHLVLSTEESVKALLFYGQSFGLSIKQIPGIQIFFTDHIIRHRFATIYHSMSMIMKPAVSLFTKMHSELHEPGLKIPRTKIEKAIESKDQTRLMAAFNSFPEMLDWWDEADSQKNRGLYVDYATEVQTPAHVTINEFRLADRITKEFRADISGLIAGMEQMSPEEKKFLLEMSREESWTEGIIRIIEHRKRERSGRN